MLKELFAKYKKHKTLENQDKIAKLYIKNPVNRKKIEK